MKSIFHSMRRKPVELDIWDLILAQSLFFKIFPQSPSSGSISMRSPGWADGWDDAAGFAVLLGVDIGGTGETSPGDSLAGASAVSVGRCHFLRFCSQVR